MNLCPSRKVPLLGTILVSVLCILGLSSRLLAPGFTLFVSPETDKSYSQVSGGSLVFVEPPINKNVERTKTRRAGRLAAIRLKQDYVNCNRIWPFEGPFNYLSQSKNPCWQDELGALRCIAYFYVPGFSKSGTSDVFARIKDHPQVAGSSKEKHYFDFHRFDNENVPFFEWFPGPTKTIKGELEETGYSNTVMGDGTPCYAFFSLKWRCFEGNEDREEPLYTTADIIHHMNPKSKLIFMLREPAARLYSRYLTWVNVLPFKAYRNPTPESFHELVSKTIAEYHECFKRWSPRNCAYNGTLYTETTLRLQEGMYSIFIKDWLKVFPKEQVLIIRFEDYIKDIAGYLPKIFSFLELDPLSDEAIAKIARKKPHNTGRHYDIGQMLPETRKLLETFYTPFARELSDFLEDKRYLWHYDD